MSNNVIKFKLFEFVWSNNFKLLRVKIELLKCPIKLVAKVLF
jgi:hypothetical protein